MGKSWNLGRLLIWLLLVVALVPGCDKLNAPEPPEKDLPTLTTQNRTTVRYGPGFDYHDIGRIGRRRSVEVLDKTIADPVRGYDPSWYGQWYRVRMDNGNIGWIPSNDVRRRSPSYIVKYDNSNYRLYNAPASDETMESIRILKAGERVTILEEEPAEKRDWRKEKGKSSRDMAKVRTESGDIGWVYTRYIDWGGIQELPYLNTPPVIYRQGNFKRMALGWSEQDLADRFGPPMSREKGIADTVQAFYNNIYLMHGNKRFKQSEIIFVNDKLVSALGMGKGKRMLVDYLPFASWLRAQPLAIQMQHFSNWFKPKFWDPKYAVEEEPLTERLFDKLPWWLRIPIQLLLAALFFLLLAHILVLPFILSIWVIGWISSMPVIPNLVLYLLFLPATALSYLWSVMMMQNVFPFNTALFIWIIAALFTWFFILMRTKNRIDYGRCPNCYHWAGVGTGSVLLGRVWTTSTTKMRRVNTRTGATLNESTSTQKETESTYEDYRQCNHCGYQWGIERTETSSGHVGR